MKGDGQICVPSRITPRGIKGFGARSFEKNWKEWEMFHQEKEILEVRSKLLSLEEGLLYRKGLDFSPPLNVVATER